MIFIQLIAVLSLSCSSRYILVELHDKESVQPKKVDFDQVSGKIICFNLCCTECAILCPSLNKVFYFLRQNQLNSQMESILVKEINRLSKSVSLLLLFSIKLYLKYCCRIQLDSNHSLQINFHLYSNELFNVRY